MFGKDMIVKTFIDARKDFATEFLAEIENEGYSTIAQVRGALYTSLEVLEKLEKSQEYEKAARLDNLTDKL